MTKASQTIFGKTKIRYFAEDESDKAWEWVEADNRCCCSTTGTDVDAT